MISQVGRNVANANSKRTAKMVAARSEEAIVVQVSVMIALFLTSPFSAVVGRCIGVIERRSAKGNVVDAADASTLRTKVVGRIE